MQENVHNNQKKCFSGCRASPLNGMAEFAVLEIAGLEIDRTLQGWTMQDWNSTDWKLTDWTIERF